MIGGGRHSENDRVQTSDIMCELRLSSRERSSAKSSYSQGDRSCPSYHRVPRIVTGYQGGTHPRLQDIAIGVPGRATISVLRCLRSGVSFIRKHNSAMTICINHYMEGPTDQTSRPPTHDVFLYYYQVRDLSASSSRVLVRKRTLYLL